MGLSKLNQVDLTILTSDKKLNTFIKYEKSSIINHPITLNSMGNHTNH